MNHDFESKEWADNHEAMSQSIDKFLQVIGASLAWLNRYEFSAPWREKDDRECAEHC